MEMLKLGPLGDDSSEGKWEETGRDKISHIFVTYSPSRTGYLVSIQFGYVENGSLVLSKKYGSGESGIPYSTRIVRLNHETEFVTGISGELYKERYITSLTFHTNERSHEAYRVELDSPVWPPVRVEFHSGIHDRRELGGFFGSCKYSSLNSIGLYIKPVISGVHTIKQENV